MPSRGTVAENSRRQSLVFFHNPIYDAEIMCLPTWVSEGETPRHEPITSGGYLRSAFVAARNSQDAILTS